MNRAIRQKLMEAENQPGLIKQWFRRTITLDRNWRKSKRKEERLRGKKENNRALTPRLNNQEAHRQKLSQPQVWPRRQEMPQQQAPTEPALMEEVERTNMVMVNSQQRAGFSQRNLYAMDVNRRENRNCCAYGGFVLWQPLITKTNDHTSGKSLKLDIKWKVHKRTRQEVSAKLESYIYQVHLVHATNN